jgi:trigger factor
VDHILSQVKVVDEPVSKEALFADDDGDESQPAADAEGKKAGKSE